MSVTSGTTESSSAPDRASAREAILRAARGRLGAGLELSIGEIAREAGVSRQTVHRHFGGARGLRSALATEGLSAAAPDEPTRDRLIEAAVRIMSRASGGPASIENIAAEAGLTKGAFYHHFSDRDELLRAVARRVSPVEELRRHFEPAADLPPAEGLATMARAYYDFMREHADLIRNLAAGTAHDPALAAVVMSEIVGEGAPLMLGWFERQFDAGRLRRVDGTLVIQALFGPAFMLVVVGGAVFDRLRAAGIHPAVDNVDAYIDIVMRGIANKPETEGGQV
jgi:AcrR family transcriptional regulator